MGPPAAYLKPIPSAIRCHPANASGVTYSDTAMCFFVGRMYWPARSMRGEMRRTRLACTPSRGQQDSARPPHSPTAGGSVHG